MPRLLAALLVAVAPFASAQDAVPAPAPVEVAPPTDWELEPPPASPGQGSGSPSEPGRQRFWEDFQTSTFDEICRNLELPGNLDQALGEYVGVGARFHRKMRRYPDRSLALIDEVRLKVSVGATEKIAQLADDIPLNLGFDARLEGAAQVIRPLGTAASCKAAKKMLKLWDFKTVVPMSEERVAGMAIGEVWKLPLTMRATGSFGVSAPVGGYTTVSVSLTSGQEEVASAMLNRLAPDQIRLRLRIDKANVFAASAGVAVAIPIADFISLDSLGENVVVNAAERAVIKQIKKYLETSLSLTKWTRDGRMVLLEFVLDPTDGAQLASLTKFLKGDLDVFKLLLRVANSAADPRVRDGRPRQELDKVEADYVQQLGADTNFAAVDDYKRKSDGFHLHLPILFGHDATKGTETDRIVSVDRDVELRIDKSYKVKQSIGFHLPFLGQMIKSRSERSVQGFVRIDANGMPESPMLVFVQQKGFLRRDQSSAREMVEDANDVLRYIGVRGTGVDPTQELPVDAMFPQPDDPERSQTYRSGSSAFTLVMNRKGIEEVLWASAETIVKAFVNTLESGSRKLMETVLSLSKVTEEGKLEYERRAVDKALKAARLVWDHEDASSAWQTIRFAAAKAAKFVQDILHAREGDWEQRNKRLVRLVAGKGQAGLHYDEVMKVLVQLTSKENFFADFIVNVNKKVKGEKDVSARYVLHKELQDDQLKQALQLRERFQDPRELSD